MKKINYLLCLFLCLSVSNGWAQRQYADSTYAPPAFEPYYSAGQGPVVVIDEGHHNFHTREGRYKPFATVLEADGFTVKSGKESFSPEYLSDVDILVIANALPESSLQKWEAPTESAFTKEEITIIEAWVKEGGRLFLLADHMPMAGAAKELAEAFGYKFHDSFADDTTTASGAEMFVKADKSLSENILTTGTQDYFEVDTIVTYTGQAFQIPEGAQSVLNTGSGWVLYLTEVAWQFEGADVLNAEGYSQGAFQEYGKGRIAVFGEAASFSSQIAEIGENKIMAGMNSRKAKNNYKLLLNILRWLSAND